LLDLDVIAFDSNYNRLDSSEETTVHLFEELKKNSDSKVQPFPAPIMIQQLSHSIEDQINDATLVN